MTKELEQQNGRHKPIVITYELDSGVRVDVKPLSLATFKAIFEKGKAEFPDPDPADYVIKPEPGTAAHDDVVISADENPEYRTLLQEAQEARAQFMHRRLLRHSITFPDFPDTAAVMAYFAPQIEALADDGLIELADGTDDRWWQTYIHCIISSADDQTMIALAAQSGVPITEGEERDALRSFRPDVSRATLRRALRESRTPGT